LQGKENSRKGPKIRIRENLQGIDFARNAYANSVNGLRCVYHSFLGGIILPDIPVCIM